MELRSGLRLRRSSPPQHGNPSGHTDLLSALPDEILLIVLARLRCVRAAMQTSHLSRRWRGLWIGLTDLTFRRLKTTRIEALLRRFVASPQVSTLDIGLPSSQAAYGGADTLLRAAVLLSPGKLIFTIQDSYESHIVDIMLPCFHCTTSIVLDTRIFGVIPVPAGDFTALESLSVTGKINDLGSLLTRCARLRVLSVIYPDQHLLHIEKPPAREFPRLEKLSLSGKIVDAAPLLNSCQHLRELSITQSDTCQLHITMPLSGYFPVLEKLSLSGNIANLRTLLNWCPWLRMLEVTFSRMEIGSLEEALTTLEEVAPLGFVLSLLGIWIPWRDGVNAARFASLLHVAARLSPLKLELTDNFEGYNFFMSHLQVNADLPCFPHVSSIETSLRNVCFTPLPAGEFLALETLSLLGPCGIVEIGTLVTRCPRLRVLKVTVCTGKIQVHSVSLQKLHVSQRGVHMECHGIDIVTPALKKLHLDVRADKDIDVSISAPAIQKLVWLRSYRTVLALVFGSWLLQSMSIRTTERSYVQNWDDTSSHVLCLRMYAGNRLDADLNFIQEIEKLPATKFSMLELKFESDWHVYGGLVLQLLRMRQIRTATKKLKIILPWWPKAKRACVKDCPCDKPKNWRSKIIIYTSLEDVDINGYNGEDHEHDFLRVIFKCSPMLKSVTVRPSEMFKGCTTELCNISSAYPSVKRYGYPSCI